MNAASPAPIAILQSRRGFVCLLPLNRTVSGEGIFVSFVYLLRRHHPTYLIEYRQST